MNLTEALKNWLVDNCGVAKDAADEVFRAKAGEAIAAGTLSMDKLKELTATQTKTSAQVLADAIASAVSKAVEPIKTELDGLKASQAAGEVVDEVQKQVDAAVAKALAERQTKSTETQTAGGAPSGTKATPAMVFGGVSSLAVNGKSTYDAVRVKSASERYSTTKSAAMHTNKRSPLFGRPAEVAGRPLDHASELEKAVIGAYFKMCVNISCRGQVPRGLRMTEHDQQLMDYAINELNWTGIVGGDGTDVANASKIDNRKLTEWEQKALLDDSTSGGLEAAPIVFDDAVILTPILHGELFPLVNVVNISRGRRIEGFSIGNPTFTSGIAEGTDVPLFDTSAYIAAFDTNIYNAVGAMEIGMDFEEDSPVNIGSIVTQRYGEKAMEWLDNQIANGDGTTEPKGLFNTSGLTDIGNPAGGAGAAPQVDDFEALLFGLPKQYRPQSEASRCVFLSNETSYRRARAIDVDATDARRIFGMTHEDYTLLNHPYKIQGDIANNLVGFFNLAHYRMYRRLGLNVRVETGGKDLARRNMQLIVVRMRFGGQLELGGYGSYTDNAQA